MGAIIAGAAIAVVGGVMQANASKKAQKKAAQDSAAAAQKAAQWEAWSAERQRKWNLEDYQRVQNYKEDSIRGFAQFAPPELQKMAPPERTTVDTSGLADFDPNDMTLNINNRKPPPGTPVAGGAGGAAQGGNGRALGQIR